LWETKVSGRRTVTHVRTVGLDPDIEAADLLKHRPIAPKIKAHFKGACCVHCGRTNRVEIDHKNDLYNDARVHDIETQQVTDFQPLCNTCNVAKRAVCRKTRETGIRQPAPFMCIQMGGPLFIEGGSDFNLDPTALGLRGTFWYDVEAYFDFCRSPTSPRQAGIAQFFPNSLYRHIHSLPSN